MNALIIDLTHSGFLIALELSKSSLFNEIWAWDLYNTMTPDQIKILNNHGVKLTEHPPDKKERDNFKIIAPIHCPLNIKIDLTHHKAVKLILESWKKDKNVKVIEITGVKGKTSVTGMLKEILSSAQPLVLSSLGATFTDNNSDITLKKNISITPASIIETINLAENYSYGDDYGICIFESSLGGTGMADVGVLTNIAEDYSIGQGKSRASNAKKQIFQSKMICCDYDTLNEFYNEFYNDKNQAIAQKINIFSLNHEKEGRSKENLINSNIKDNANLPECNITAHNIKYGLRTTSLLVNVKNLKTINQNILNCSFSLKTFAPAPYHVRNILAAVCAALTLNISTEQIKNGLKKFSGLEGRSSIKTKDDITIIEEINPGINVKAIENTIEMAKNMKDSIVILGGQYGITCEEIDENLAAEYLNNLTDEVKLIFTDELGQTISKKMNYPPIYLNNPQTAINNAIKRGAKNIIFIYRSNYANLKLR